MKHINKHFLLGVVLAYVSAVLYSAQIMAAGEGREVHIVLENHLFQPAEVIVPARARVVLVIENRDATPEEFESHSMHREKIIAGNKTEKIPVGPLKPGKYPFYGDFNPDSAQGVVVAQ